MSVEELGQIVQQIQGPAVLTTPNALYSAGTGICQGYGNNGFIISNPKYPFGRIVALFSDLYFEKSIINCENMQLNFAKEIYNVTDGSLIRKIDRVISVVDPDKLNINLQGNVNNAQFWIGPRKIGFIGRWLPSFSKSYLLFQSQHNALEQVKDVNNIVSKSMSICLYDNSGSKIFMINFNANNNTKFNIGSNMNGDVENLAVSCLSNALMSNLKISVDALNYNVDEIERKYGKKAVISILGYTAVALNAIYHYVLNFVYNDSHAAIISLAILLLTSSNIAYLLHLLLALLRLFRRKDNKHINDNEDGITTFILSIIRNWHYVYGIFTFYAIYGITSSKTIIQYLTINHGTFLNAGKTILEPDNTFRFLATKHGYISIMKIAVLLIFMARQIYAILSKQTPLKPAHGIGAAIILGIIYHVQYSYAFILVLILGNIVGIIKEAMEGRLGYVKK